MELIHERDRLLEKMFDAALKEKINLLARIYDHDLVFGLWTQLVKIGALKIYFCKWRWKPNMTMSEAMDCLDDYCNGLEKLLQIRLEMRQTPPGGKYKRIKLKF